MILVYANEITPRIEYIMNVFFNQIFCAPFSITKNESEFIKYDGAKINYAIEKNNRDGLFIAANSLLFTNNIDKKLKNFYKVLYVCKHRLGQHLW